MIFITYYDLYCPSVNIGIKKKILGQIQAFTHTFGKVYHTCYMGQMMYLLDGEMKIEKEFAITQKDCNEIICAWLNKYKIKRTYIRYAFADKWFIKFLKYQNEHGITSVIEIPTYPYDGERLNNRIKIEDTNFRKEMYKYVNLIATNSNETEIWGIKSVPLLNGIDISNYKLYEKRTQKEGLILIGVGSLMFWLGYERILEGLSNYYKEGGTCDIHFKIVGEGPERDYYHSLVMKYNLHDHVEFCGRLSGTDLDKQYEQSDIAVSSLGCYKKGVHDVTPLKGAEYCVWGLPFICGYHDMRFKGDEEFILNVANDSQPIDMKQVLAFYHKLSKHTKYKKEMYEYAIKYLSWDVVLKPVIEYLK